MEREIEEIEQNEPKVRVFRASKMTDDTRLGDRAFGLGSNFVWTPDQGPSGGKSHPVVHQTRRPNPRPSSRAIALKKGTGGRGDTQA